MSTAAFAQNDDTRVELLVDAGTPLRIALNQTVAVTHVGQVVTGTIVEPLYAYDRIGFTATVIGGGIYRGTPCGPCNFPAEYEGDYFMSDYYEGFMRRIKFDGTSWAVAPAVAGQPSAGKSTLKAVRSKVDAARPPRRVR